MTNRGYFQLCLHACACASADPLNFAADQAEIEIFHGLKKMALRKKWREMKKGWEGVEWQ